MRIGESRRNGSSRWVGVGGGDWIGVWIGVWLVIGVWIVIGARVRVWVRVRVRVRARVRVIRFEGDGYNYGPD